MENRLNPSHKEEPEDIIDREIEFNIAFARETYKRIKKFAPMVVGISKGKHYVLPFYWEKPEEKVKLAEAIKGQFRKLGVTAIVFMSEAWSSHVRHPALMNKDIRPSEQLNRQEVFIMNYTDKDKTIGIILPIERIGDEVTLGVLTKSDKQNIEVKDYLWGDYFKEEK